MRRMRGKTALIVGGATGIGYAIADRLAAEGAAVFLTSRRRLEAEAAAERIGAGSHALVADPSDKEDLRAIVATVQAERGRIDALVLNAGTSDPVSLVEVGTKHLDRPSAIGAGEPASVLEVAAPIMADGAAAVLVGTFAEVPGHPTFDTSASTRAALLSFARAWAAELAPQGVRVNVVSPGPTETGNVPIAPDQMRLSLVARVLLGRMAGAEEVAAAAVFLLSDDASFVTGTELCVDGGMQVGAL